MDSRNIEQIGTPRQGIAQHDPDRANLTQACGGLLAFLEIAVASIIVVGFFDAVSQPLGWTSAAQSFLCACLALLLWRVDAMRETSEPYQLSHPIRCSRLR